MDFNKLKRQLAKEATAAGICDEWREKILTATSREYLLQLAVKGSDFVTLKNFPSDDLAAEFADIAPHLGIYIGQPVSTVNARFVLTRGAWGVVSYDDFSVGDVYACRDTLLNVKARDYAKVSVTVMEGAEVDVTAEGKATVKIFQHGGKIKTDAADGANIKIINE